MAKTVKTRIMLKHDYEANWKDAAHFTPFPGEIIVYDADIDAPTSPKNLRGTHELPRLKMGDGKTLINDLPFLLEKSFQGELTNQISFGTTDPDVNTVGQFYFKYSN